MVDLASFPDIYARIKQVIGAATQREVAQHLGISQQLLSDLLNTAKGRTSEKGPKNLPYKILVDWALSNRVSLEWLLTGESLPADHSIQLALPVSDHETGKPPVGDALTEASAKARQEAVLLGAETSLWLERQSVTNTQHWPELVSGLWDFRSKWEAGVKPPMVREPPAQDEAGPARDKAAGSKG